MKSEEIFGTCQTYNINLCYVCEDKDYYNNYGERCRIQAYITLIEKWIKIEKKYGNNGYVRKRIIDEFSWMKRESSPAASWTLYSQFKKAFALVAPEYIIILEKLLLLV